MVNKDINSGHANLGFDRNVDDIEIVDVEMTKKENYPKKLKQTEDRSKQRPKWDNQREFLMSCIATSVGLGNVWRFPFVAYQNGGGAFLIPYIIVLMVVGRPMYYLETVVGQFSSSNTIKIWKLCPAMKGTGYAQALGAILVLSYYVSIIALCLFYLFVSFKSPLPWAVCQPDWLDCVPSGTPLWDLTLYLFLAWLCIFFIVAKGIKSSGKASCFLALFPYVIMFILLIRSVTLPGASKGILFFITPQWEKILELQVWYAAITQVFFSLSVCSGALIMFSSYNDFSRNIYRDSLIVTTLDTFTSLISGITIFGVLGNLASELNYEDVGKVIGSGGTSLAFISYPDAIAKSPILPQLFAVLFFVMLAVLGIGSGVAILSVLNTVLLDAFPRVPTIYLSAFSCSVGFVIGLVYVTPGGQYILELVDFYGGTFMRMFAAISEAIGVIWIYGLENLCIDIEFMLGIKTSFYWRMCWSIVTPVLMIVVFLYAFITTEQLVFGEGYVYPQEAYYAGYAMQYVGIALIPIFIAIALCKYRSNSVTKTVSFFRLFDSVDRPYLGVVETVRAAFQKTDSYGPYEQQIYQQWLEFT